MRHLTIAILLSAAAAWAGAADLRTVRIWWQGQEVLLFDTRGACESGWLRGGRYPPGEKHKYVMGCWYIDDKALNIQFKDGVHATIDKASLNRSQIGKLQL